MREIRSYGSVRGATRDSRPYRDRISETTAVRRALFGSRPFSWLAGKPALIEVTCDSLCARCVRAPGSNRHVVGNERVLQERSSEPS